MSTDVRGAAATIDDVVATYQLYGFQCQAIDSGDAQGWAATFTEDGIFSSPTYASPAEGRSALTKFAEQFAADCRQNNQVLRHVVTNLKVEQIGDSLKCLAYLQIIGTKAGQLPQLHRITVIDDDLVRTSEGLLVAVRRVRPD